MREAVLLDMDHTLINGNSAYFFMKYLRREGRVSLRQMAQSVYWLLQYRFNVIDMASVSRRAFAQMAGDAEAELLQHNDRWFDEYIRPAIFRDALAMVASHQRKGRLLAIVTASTRYAAEPLARHLGIEHLICTRLVVRNGHFTGRFEEPMCYGDGKVHWVREFAHAHDVDLSRSFFYTDSLSDLPLLRAVGHPVAVNPDPKLLRHSLRVGWPILRFR